DLVVESKVLCARQHVVIAALNKSVRTRHHSLGTHRFEIVGGIRVAQVLAELQIIVEAVFERIADRVLFQLVAIDTGYAEIAAVRDMAVGIRQKRYLSGYVLLVTLVIDFRVLREQREGRVHRWTPGEARRDEQPVILHEVGLSIAVTGETDNAVEVLTLLVDRAADIEGALESIKRTEGTHDFILRSRSRPLADHVDQTARFGLPVKAGRRAF